jgi:hypothetical protein
MTIEVGKLYFFMKSGNKVRTIAPAAPYLGVAIWKVEKFRWNPRKLSNAQRPQWVESGQRRTSKTRQEQISMKSADLCWMDSQSRSIDSLPTTSNDNSRPGFTDRKMRL